MPIESAASVNRVIPAVDGTAMPEDRVSRGIVAEHFDRETGSRLEQRARRQNLNFHGYDFVGRHRLTLTMRVPRPTRTAATGEHLRPATASSFKQWLSWHMSGPACSACSPRVEGCLRWPSAASVRH